jgi:ribosome-binding factor A
MPAPHRAERVSDEIRRRLTELIHGELKDPRVSFLSSITRVDMSPDLRYAKVFVSVMGAPDEQEASITALKHAAGFLRRELGADLRLRHTPELHFVLDHSIEEGDKVLRLMREVEQREQQSRD